MLLLIIIIFLPICIALAIAIKKRYAIKRFRQNLKVGDKVCYRSFLGTLVICTIESFNKEKTKAWLVHHGTYAILTGYHDINILYPFKS